MAGRVSTVPVQRARAGEDTAPSGRARAARGGTWAARLLAVGLGMAIPLVALEVVLRLFGPVLPGNYDTGLYLERHADLGHFHVPGFDGWIKTSEFTTRIQIGPLGLRDRRTTYERGDATRVLLLGDSFVEGVQVAAEDTVAMRLEAGLTRAVGRPVEVLNAGVAGYGTGHELLLLEHEGLRYRPDVVVLVVFLGNDVGDNAYRPELEPGERARRPYWTPEPDGSLRLHPGAPPVRSTGPVEALRSCCLLYNVFETGVLLKLGIGLRRDAPHVEDDARYLVRSLYDTRPDGEMLRAWQITERLVGQVRERVAAEGLGLLVVGAPDWLALDEAAWSERLGGSRAGTARFAPDAPNRRLGEIAERVGVPYVDLFPHLKGATGAGPLYFPIDTHWTPAGHAVVAAAIEARLLELGLVGR